LLTPMIKAPLLLWLYCPVIETGALTCKLAMLVTVPLPTEMRSFNSKLPEANVTLGAVIVPIPLAG